MSRIALAQVTKSFPGPHGDMIPAVRDLTLEIEPGELLTLVGPSGCGKTTTLRLIAGLERPDAGEIRFDGQVCNSVPPHKRDVAFVFQTAALYPQMSVRENLEFGLRVRRLPRSEIEQRVQQALEMLELTVCASRLPHELSGGQAQRVALGRALVRCPSVFLLDEPLAHLDEPARVQLRAWIQRVHGETRATMVYVTHDHREALALGTRVAVMDRGAWQQLGSPDEVYHQPANPFVASFVGSRPMNLIPGRIGSTGEHVWFEPENSDEAVLSLPPGIVATDGLAEGTRATLGLRPEHFTLHKPPGAEESWRVPGRVVSLRMWDGDTMAVITQWGREVSVRITWENETALKPGAAVAVWADLRHAMIYPEA